MTTFTFSIGEADDDVAELHDLYEAILDDDGLKRARKSLAPGQPQPGQMGAEEAIRLVVDSPALWTAVSSCVTAWLATRESKMTLVVSAIRSAGIEADGNREVTPAEVEQALKTASGEHKDAAPQQ